MTQRPSSGRRPSAPTGARERCNARAIFGQLKLLVPEARTALHHENPFQLLIGTILSAQCTDERVNLVTPGLFRMFPGPEQFAAAGQTALEGAIRSTGFFRMKARNIIACSETLMKRHGGKVPRTMEELVALPGVGRKTANVVLGQAFGIAAGVVVDTHIHRLSRRLGFTDADTPEKIEQDLMKLFPESDWIALGSVLILHGRSTCQARTPRCRVCVVRDLCPSATTFLRGEA